VGLDPTVRQPHHTCFSCGTYHRDFQPPCREHKFVAHLRAIYRLAIYGDVYVQSTARHTLTYARPREASPLRRLTRIIPEDLYKFHKPAVIKRVGNTKGVTVPSKIVPFVHIDPYSGVAHNSHQPFALVRVSTQGDVTISLVGHDFVEKSLLCRSAAVVEALCSQAKSKHMSGPYAECHNARLVLGQYTRLLATRSVALVVPHLVCRLLFGL
jgi:hypothetical protein